MLTGLALAWLAWLLVKPEAPPDRAASAGRAATPPEANRGIAARELQLPEHPLAALPEQAAPLATPGASQAPAVPRGQMPRQILEQLQEEDPLMGTFQSYHQRALLSPQGLAQYQALLSEPENIAAVEQALLSAGTGEMTIKEHFHRLMQIDFLQAGLTWKQNPARDRLLETVRQIILYDNFTAGQEVERQYALAGAKMELYHLLAEHAPDQAQRVVEKARGTRLEKLVTFLAQRDERLRAKENLQAGAH
jgi:hypothetical protein